jgi:hypothetical protein
MDDVDDSFWFGDTGRVIDRMRLYLGLHPKRAPDWNGDAVERNRPLPLTPLPLLLSGRL